MNTEGLLKLLRDRMQKDGGLLSSDPGFISGYDKVVEMVNKKEVYLPLSCYLSIKALVFVFFEIAIPLALLLLALNFFVIGHFIFYWPIILAVVVALFLAGLLRKSGRHRYYGILRIILEESKAYLEDR